MNREFRKAAILALNNPDITNQFIQGCIDQYAAVSDDQLLIDLKTAKAEFTAAGGRGVELADSIDAMRVARAIRKVKP